ncbi:MAG: hypothetical protein OXG99_15125 [Alphaproteobacteria bacterium]|nr:hypothetical protein [Alphaproteobacteria bacterium]
MAHAGLMLRSLTGGGAERSVLVLTEGLVARGHRVDLVFVTPPDDFHPRRMPKGVRAGEAARRAGRKQLRNTGLDNMAGGKLFTPAVFPGHSWRIPIPGTDIPGAHQDNPENPSRD